MEGPVPPPRDDYGNGGSGYRDRRSDDYDRYDRGSDRYDRRDRGDRGDRRDRRDRDSHRDRDRDSHRDRDRSRRSRSPARDRGGRSSRRSRSPQRRSRAESKSPSKTPPPRERKRNKKSEWDVGPGGNITAPIDPHLAAAANFLNNPNSGPSSLGAAAVATMDSSTLASAAHAVAPQVANLQQTRHARRVYVGNLPVGTNEDELKHFFNNSMTAASACPGNEGDAVLTVYINHEKKFAFVEFKTVEETNACMQFDGIQFRGLDLRIRRPNDYNPSAAALIPQGRTPDINLSALGVVATSVPDGPNKVFIGGLPYTLTEEQVKELISTFGNLKAFHLVKDNGISKGYGFFEYSDPSVTDKACAGLNGLKVSDKTLTVRRATGTQVGMGMEGVDGPGLDFAALSAAALSNVAMNPMIAALPTKVLQLLQMVTSEDLQDEEEYEDILEDIREECGRYGKVEGLVIPRPTADNANPPGLGKVYVKFADLDGSRAAQKVLAGRRFAGRTVVANYYSEDKFDNNEY